MKIKNIPIDQLSEDPKNPNEMTPRQRKALRNSLEKYGFVQPLVVTDKLQVINGNQKLAVAKEMGIKKIPCYVMDENLTEEDRLILQQILNKVHGTHDKAKDQAIFDQLFKKKRGGDMALALGTNESTFLKNMERAKLKAESTNDHVKSSGMVKTGDLWLLGRHKVLCGDCTKSEDVSRLLGTNKVAQCLTDPPYGVSYSEKNKQLNKQDNGSRITSPIINDNLDNYYLFYKKFLELIPFEEYNTCYIFSGNYELHNLRRAMDTCGYHFGQYLIWLKNNHVMGHLDYMLKHEVILYAWMGKHKFYGAYGGVSVLNFDKPTVSNLHPTQKPIELLRKLVEDGTPQEGALVYDPFLGSGSTLITCEQTNRKCYGIEIDPAYVETIIIRWESMTNQKAVKLGTKEV